MIILIGGIPCSGKTELMKRLIHRLETPVEYEPIKLFRCQKHGDVLVLGQYATEEIFGGTDRLSYGTINKFRDFIEQEYPKHRHIIVEGDRFFRAKDIEWVVENYVARVFILTVNPEEEKRRHLERQDTQTEKWLQGRRTQIKNLLTNFQLMGNIDIRENNTSEDSKKIEEELYRIIL